MSIMPYIITVDMKMALGKILLPCCRGLLVLVGSVILFRCVVARLTERL